MSEKHRAYHDRKPWFALGISTLALAACIKPDVPQQLPENTPTSPAVLLQQGEYFLQRQNPVKVGKDTVTFHQYESGVCRVDINGTDTDIPIDNAQAFPKGTPKATFEVVCNVEEKPNTALIKVFGSQSQ